MFKLNDSDSEHHSISHLYFSIGITTTKWMLFRIKGPTSRTKIQWQSIMTAVLTVLALMDKVRYSHWKSQTVLLYSEDCIKSSPVFVLMQRFS